MVYDGITYETKSRQYLWVTWTSYENGLETDEQQFTAI